MTRTASPAKEKEAKRYYTSNAKIRTRKKKVKGWKVPTGFVNLEAYLKWRKSMGLPV